MKIKLSRTTASLFYVHSPDDGLPIGRQKCTSHLCLKRKVLSSILVDESALFFHIATDLAAIVTHTRVSVVRLWSGVGGWRQCIRSRPVKIVLFDVLHPSTQTGVKSAVKNC